MVSRYGRVRLVMWSGVVCYCQLNRSRDRVRCHRGGDTIGANIITCSYVMGPFSPLLPHLVSKLMCLILHVRFLISRISSRILSHLESYLRNSSISSFSFPFLISLVSSRILSRLSHISCRITC